MSGQHWKQERPSRKSVSVLCVLRPSLALWHVPGSSISPKQWASSMITCCSLLVKEDPVTGFFYTCFWLPSDAFWIFCPNVAEYQQVPYVPKTEKSVRWGQELR